MFTMAAYAYSAKNSPVTIAIIADLTANLTGYNLKPLFQTVNQVLLIAIDKIKIIITEITQKQNEQIAQLDDLVIHPRN